MVWIHCRHERARSLDSPRISGWELFADKDDIEGRHPFMASLTRPGGQGSADELNAKGLECNRRGDTRGGLFLEAHQL